MLIQRLLKGIGLTVMICVPLYMLDAVQRGEGRPRPSEGRATPVAIGQWSLAPMNAHWPKNSDQGGVKPSQWELTATQITPPLQGLAQLAAGLGWFREGLYFRASQAFKSADHSLGPLQEVVLFFWGESLFHQGRYKRSLEVFDRLQVEYPGSLWSHRVRFRRADLLGLLGDVEGSTELLESLLRRYPEYPYKKATLLQMSHYATSLGDTESAKVWRSEILPGSIQDVSSQRALLWMAVEESPLPSPQEHLNQVVEWRKWKYYEEALSEVRRLQSRDDLSSDFVRKAALEEIRILNKMERFKEVLTFNEAFNERERVPRWRRTNFWWTSEALFRLGHVQEATDVFKKSRTSPRSAGNLARLGMIYFNGGLYNEAEDAFKEAVERGTKGDPDLWMARRLLGWLPYRLGRYAEAIRRFKRMCQFGRGRNHYAHYWWARSLQKVGDQVGAIKVYRQLIKRAPYSFYAYLAQVRLKEVGITAQVPWVNDSQERNTAPEIVPPINSIEALKPIVQRYGAQLPLWEAIYGLALIGERRWAMIYMRSLTEENRAYFQSSGAKRRRWSFAPRFYKDYRDDVDYGVWGEREAQKAPRDPQWAKGLSQIRPTQLRKTAAKVYSALGDHYYGRRVALYDGPSLTYPEAEGEGPEWQRRYPRSFRSAVESSAARYGVDPHLIWALMTVESSHNPWAISRVGARGLMQVMPHTGQLSADRLGWAYFGSPLLFEPEVAIEMAAWYFQQLLLKFNGQLPLAMAAYNAGPHRVKVWLEFKGHLPLDELIEEIPYAQAREYAKKVTRHLGLYRRIYEGYPGQLFDLKVNPFVRENINF